MYFRVAKGSWGKIVISWKNKHPWSVVVFRTNLSMRTERETLVWKTTTKASRANQIIQNSWLYSYFLSDQGGEKYPEYLQ